MPRTVPIFRWLVVALIVGLNGCSKPTEPAADKSAQKTVNVLAAGAQKALIVSAAASTKEVMEALAEQFKADTGAEVKVNLGSSSALAAQILAAHRQICFFQPTSNGLTK